MHANIVVCRCRIYCNCKSIYVTKATCSAANQHPSCVLVTACPFLYQRNLSLMEYISLFFLLADRENQSILITYVLSHLLIQSTSSLYTGILQIDSNYRQVSHTCWQWLCSKLVPRPLPDFISQLWKKLEDSNAECCIYDLV